MSKVVKIESVYLYNSGILSSEEELSVKKLLDDSNIPYIELAYNDPVQHADVLKALSTWYWGEDKSTRTFTSFPMVHWKEYYDDLFPMDFNVINLKELTGSSLLKNKNAVVKI